MIIIKKVLIFFIKLYRVTPLHCHSMCNFTPTCSQYTIDALNKYGVIKGLKLGIKRILRCHPKGKCGYDPLR